MNQFFSSETPSFDVIRQWVYRFGLYLLERHIPRRTDYILILDHTVESGKPKCLLLLLVSEEQLKKSNYCLQHEDMIVAGIERMTSSTGEKINQKLNDLSKRVGEFVQIVSDHGPDIKKGAELYQQDHSDVILTYDVTHKMGSLLKKYFEKDVRWQSFSNLCSLSIAQVKQTELYFLIPPKQRVKGRYLNLDLHVKWAEKILLYEQDHDFSLISTHFKLEKEDLDSLHELLDQNAIARLSLLTSKEYDHQKAFLDDIDKVLSKPLSERIKKTILDISNIGKKRFYEKFDWITDFSKEIAVYSQIMNLVEAVEKQLKKEGIHKESVHDFKLTIKNYFLSTTAENFKKEIITYLQKEGDQILENKILLGTSDIIESIFGSYKIFNLKSSIKEIGKMVLLLPILTTKISTKLVKTALETITCTYVNVWSMKVFGISMFSKRKQAFCKKDKTQKVNEKLNIFTDRTSKNSSLEDKSPNNNSSQNSKKHTITGQFTCHIKSMG